MPASITISVLALSIPAQSRLESDSGSLALRATANALVGCGAGDATEIVKVQRTLTDECLRVSMFNICEVSRRVARAILLTVAALYFLIDLIFLSMVRALRRRIMDLTWVRQSREWIGELNRYTAFLLLLVPWLILEPIKPIGFLLFSHKHHLAATLLVVGGEVVKLTLFEQLFDMIKPKLMSFHWFARSYSKWRNAIDYLRSLTVWRRMRDWHDTLQVWVQRR